MTLSQVVAILNLLDDIKQKHLDQGLSEHDLALLNHYENYVKSVVNQQMTEIKSKGNYLKLRLDKLEEKLRLDFFGNFQAQEPNFSIIKSLLESLVNWEYPALEVFPGVGQFLPFMLGAEPLYIADRDQYILDHAASLFNEFYANKRLMRYLIKDYDFSELPQNSFGLVYAYNYMRFEDTEGLLDFAKNSLDLLLPGGHLFFVYNPSDMYWGIQEVEFSRGNVVFSEDLEAGLNKLGYEFVRKAKDDPYLTYMLLKKPGELQSIKASSILGKVIDRPQDLV